MEDPAIVIPDAISAAAAAWNYSGARVLICENDVVDGTDNCVVGGTEKNSDSKDVVINVVQGGKVGPIHRGDPVLPTILGATHCGWSYACVKPRGFSSIFPYIIEKLRWLPLISDHMQDLTMVIEEPAWTYSTSDESFTGLFWTGDSSDHNEALSSAERADIPGLESLCQMLWKFLPGGLAH